jgi:hypothetical protein
MMNWHDLDDFTQAYIECILWAELDYSDPDTGGDPLDENYDFFDISPEALATIVEDCADFQDAQADDLALVDDDERSGHDFWLTRNHHGAGFWDRGLGEVGDRLTAACKIYDSQTPYVSDDGKIYLM